MLVSPLWILLFKAVYSGGVPLNGKLWLPLIGVVCFKKLDVPAPSPLTSLFPRELAGDFFIAEHLQLHNPMIEWRVFGEVGLSNEV